MTPLGATSRALSGTTRPEAPAQTTVEPVARRPRASRTVIRPNELQMLDLDRPSFADVEREIGRARRLGEEHRERVLRMHLARMYLRALRGSR